MDDPQSPQDRAYGQRAGRTVADRNREREEKELAKNPIIQAIRALEKRLQTVEVWQANAQGHNGINVNGNVFSIDARALRPQAEPASSGSAIAGTKDIWIIEGGVAVEYRFAAIAV